jgi:hypothetical protein
LAKRRRPCFERHVYDKLERSALKPLVKLGERPRWYRGGRQYQDTVVQLGERPEAIGKVGSIKTP